MKALKKYIPKSPVQKEVLQANPSAPGPADKLEKLTEGTRRDRRLRPLSAI